MNQDIAYQSPFPPRRPKPPRTLLSYLWGGITGLFDIRWLLGMRPAIVDRPAPERVTVSILIPAYYKEAGRIIPAVESLFERIDHPIYSIIIVQNGTEIGKQDDALDEARYLAQKYRGKVFALCAGIVESKAGALNAGLNACGVPTDASAEPLIGPTLPVGELIVELDADTKLGPNAIRQLLPHFYDENIAVACGAVDVQPYTGKWPSIWFLAKRIEYILGQGLTKSAQNHLGAVVVMCGCFSIFHRSLIGRFTPRTMAEDMDKTWELMLQGYKSVFENLGVSYASEPEDIKTYWGQRWRWQCGFLQCYQLYAWKMLRQNLLLFIVTGYMFLCAFMGIVVDIVLLPFGIYYFTKNPTLAAVLPIAINLAVMAFALICYTHRQGIGAVLLSLASIPAAIVGSFVNQANLLKAIVWEWILQIHLEKWVLGHAEHKSPVPTEIPEIPSLAINQTT